MVNRRCSSLLTKIRRLAFIFCLLVCNFRLAYRGLRRYPICGSLRSFKPIRAHIRTYSPPPSPQRRQRRQRKYSTKLIEIKTNPMKTDE